LNHVVPLGPPAVRSELDAAQHVSCSFERSLVKLEALSENVQTLGFETRIAGVEDQFYQSHELVSMLSHCQESLDRHFDEQSVCFGFRTASKDVDVLLGELEIYAFKTHILSRRPVKHEPKVNMDQMAVIVNHDVSVVPIFDLQDVGDYTVSGQTADEIVSGRSELLRMFVSILLQKVLIEIDLKSFTKLVSAVGIRDNFDNAT